MIFPGFTFKGVHSGSFGLYVSTKSFPTLPSRVQTRIAIPGRSGSLVFDGEPDNKKISLMLTSTESFTDRRKTARKIAAWLSGVGELVMDYEPDMTYRVVSAVNNISTEIAAGYDTFVAEFECEPYQYGVMRRYAGSVIDAQNNGTAPSDTIIEISGTGNIYAAAGEQSLTLSGISGTVIVDSRRMLVYSPPSQNMMPVHSGGFIQIPPGGVNLSFIGSISDVSVEYREAWL